MFTSSASASSTLFPHEVASRGYHAVYRPNQVNHCPGCGRTHWYVGRQLAECGFCSTALPLVDAISGGGSHSRNRKAAYAFAA
ncbi:MAG TPA: hypothetical protein VF631_05705 [Allosphingosinicella sp.]|jgi:hypothetical protein|uniref:hypothetical protein n=1 Tax=Allosphingosinicella sp. TaxID=2823234 RepID=UPI002F290217